MRYKVILEMVINWFFHRLLPLHKPPTFICEVQINHSAHELYVCKVEFTLLAFICSVLHLIRIWKPKTLFHSLGRDLSLHLLTFKGCCSWRIDTLGSPFIFRNYPIPNIKKKVYVSLKFVQRTLLITWLTVGTMLFTMILTYVLNEFYYKWQEHLSSSYF